MATRSVSRAGKAQSRSPELDLDRTDGRIRAFLASMRPLRGSSGGNSDEYHRGRSLIERMAVGVEDCDRPELRLTPAECADVLYFFALSEPIEPREWWHDPQDAPSRVVGYQLVVGVLEDSLREAPLPRSTADSTAPGVIGLGEIWGALVEECSAHRLIYNTLACYHDARIGEPVTEDMAEDLGAVFNELGHSMKRLEAIGDDVDELRATTHKGAQS